MTEINLHTPVLLKNILQYLEIFDSEIKKVIFDGTFGGGGYSTKFLEVSWKVFACDLDQNAIDQFFRNNAKYKKNSKLQIVNKSFADYINEFPDSFFEAIVLDLGFSSNQLSSSGRGFSFKNIEETLDLRFDDSGGEPIWKKLRNLDEPFELQKILYTYSGEQLSRRLARATFELLQKTEGSLTVGQLTSTLTEAIPAKFKPQTNSILSRVWQALRIWTNDELTSLNIFLDAAPKKLKPGGRLVIVSFHSLEDKLVTKQFRRLAKPRSTDEFGNTIKDFKLLTSKGVKPTDKEVEINPRSRSAILRVLEKLEN